ncbi:ABC transporter [Trueperella pyogenes TP8]|uniref:ABC transporter ATP-binding protein n=1 Tax=Trueperella pyogenes TaxID=1661 RepID=UPI0005809768|nr:ABC transporter ATP-binding protein [Trueperella pyogenes]AJC69101.1 ABC transporter [Trueperella pyogenes TP8]
MIRFENVEVAYDDFVAIPDFNLNIKEGDFFTFLGPSGCGKTTVLRALAGLIEPTRGKIYIDGRDVTKQPSDKRQVGMVFQNYALFPTMSVYENIAFGLKVNKLPKDEIEEHVKNIAREVELTGAQLQRNISELSGGQQQRVAIARSLVMRPKILLLDEPLSNLDAKLRQQLRVQIKEMQRHFGITSVYVTHDQTEALSMSDGIAVINQGKIEQVGTAREVYSHSKTEFVCNFIGDANKLPVDVLRNQHVDIKGSNVYVRIERVDLNAPNAPLTTGQLCFPGQIVDSRYEGTSTTYLVDYGQAEAMRVIAKEDGSLPFRVGDKCLLSIDSKDLLFYQS